MILSSTLCWAIFFSNSFTKYSFTPTIIQTLHWNPSSCYLSSSKCNIATFVHNPPTFYWHQLGPNSSFVHLLSPTTFVDVVDYSNILYLPPPNSFFLPLLPVLWVLQNLVEKHSLDSPILNLLKHFPSPSFP